MHFPLAVGAGYSQIFGPNCLTPGGRLVGMPAVSAVTLVVPVVSTVDENAPPTRAVDVLATAGGPSSASPPGTCCSRSSGPNGSVSDLAFAPNIEP